MTDSGMVCPLVAVRRLSRFVVHVHGLFGVVCYVPYPAMCASAVRRRTGHHLVTSRFTASDVVDVLLHHCITPNNLTCTTYTPRAPSLVGLKTSVIATDHLVSVNQHRFRLKKISCLDNTGTLPALASLEVSRVAYICCPHSEPRLSSPC